MVSEFMRHLPALQQVAQAVAAELTEALAHRGVVVHLVASRIKDPVSLRRKLARPEKTYQQLWDVTDLVGLRITTYFEDTVEDIARLIEQTYPVDFRHSTDKLRFADATTFGYRSLHYVCATPARTASAPHPAFRFEIQVRTALQHAWAEVEHDLGYKADAVPAQIRRRFSRIASLLEIADQEFVAIRSELKSYQTQIQQQLGTGNASSGNNVHIDEVSLATLVGTPAVVALDQAVATALQRPCATTDYFPAYLVKLLRCAGLSTSNDVRDALANYSDEVPAIIDEYFVFSQQMWRFGRDAIPAIERGYGLFFLAHLAILRGPELMLSRVARLTAMYQQLDDLDAQSAHELANGLLHAFGA